MAVKSQTVPRFLLNRTEIAIALGVSPTTIDVMVQEGRLPPPRTWHSRKFWRVSEIEAATSEWPMEGSTHNGDAAHDWAATV